MWYTEGKYQCLYILLVLVLFLNLYIWIYCTCLSGWSWSTRFQRPSRRTRFEGELILTTHYGFRYFSVPFFKLFNFANLSGYCRRRGSIWKSRAIWKRGIIDVKCCSDIFPRVFKVLILSCLVFSPSPGLFWCARLNGHSRNPRTKGVVIRPL